MQAQIKSVIIVILMLIVSAGFVRAAAVGPLRESVAPVEETNIPAVPNFPYAAMITENEVPIRSGPGTNYYMCGKLNRNDKVDVVGSQFSWSRIVPPPNSFSWISMRFISIDPVDPTVGIVTAEGIRVYAGSEYKEPLHSDILQLRLNRGDKVKLLGQKKGDYQKIAPPTGAYLWISTKYIKPLGEAIVTPRIVGPVKIDTKIGPEAIFKTNLPLEMEKLKEYYALEKQIQAEREKPLQQQNYENINKALIEIADNKEAGRAARYAAFSIKQIQRFGLALKVAKAVQLQNEELQNTKDKIQKARDTRLAQHANLGRFAIMGRFQTSNIFSSEAGLKLYRVTQKIGETDKTICYALPVGPTAKMDLSKFTEQKVGLIGTIAPHPQTSRVLVKFTNIVELNEEL